MIQLSKVRSEFGTSLITMYIPGKTNINQITSMINSEISKCSNIKNKNVKNNVSSSLLKILNDVKYYKEFPKNGLAIFCGETTDGLVNEVVEPNKYIDRFFYKCDNKFYV